MASTPWNIKAVLSSEAHDVLYGMDKDVIRAKIAIIMLLQGEPIEKAQHAVPQPSGFRRLLQSLAAGLRRIFGLSSGEDADDLIAIEAHSERAMTVDSYLVVHRPLTPLELKQVGFPQGPGLAGHFITQIIDLNEKMIDISPYL